MNGLLICGLFSLVTTGRCLNCVQCTNTSAFCSGKVENCTGAELCMSRITQTIDAAGQKTSTFERRCGDTDHCNTSASMSSFLSTETSSMCCNTETCTPPAPTLIIGNKVANHIQCPVCFGHKAEQCSNPNVRNCTGDERYCAVYEVKSNTGITIIMGCASESFCHTAQSQKLVDGQAISAKCTRSGSGRLRYQSVCFLLVLILGKIIDVALRSM